MFSFAKKRTTSQSVQERCEEFEKIFNNPIIDLPKLENLCFQGIPENRELKAKCWKLLLGYLPLKTDEWEQHLHNQRNLYEFYINLLFQNPETYNNGTNLNTNQSSSNSTHHRSTTQTLTSQTPKITKTSKKQTFTQDKKQKKISFNSRLDTIKTMNNTHSAPVPTFKPQIPQALHYFQDDEKQKKPLSTLFFNSSEDDDCTQTKDALFEDAHEQSVIIKDEIFSIPSKDINHNSNISDTIDDDFESSVVILDTPRHSIIKGIQAPIIEINDEDEDEEEIILFTPSSTKTISDDTRNLSSLKDIIPDEKDEKSSNLTFDKIEKITDDPLNTLPNNPWQTYFDDWEIWNRIEKDIHRTHQTYAFFRSNHMIPKNTASNRYRFPFDIIRKHSPTPTLSSMTFQTPSLVLKSNSKGSNGVLLPPSPHSITESPSIVCKKTMKNNDQITDIESVDSSDSDDYHMSANVPAPRHLVCPASSPNPNKKARIERYAMDSKQHGIHAQIMIRILCVYARLNKGVQYVQGMNELLAPIYYIFTLDTSDNNIYAEADSFFCFMNLMSYLADRFIPEADNTQIGILATVAQFDQLLKRIDIKLWTHLFEQDLDTRFYSLRWLLLLMAMEFQLPEVLRLWDSFISDHRRFEFVTYFAVAMMLHVRPQLMAGGFATNLQMLQKFPAPDLYELLVPAIKLRDKYPIKECIVYNYSVNSASTLTSMIVKTEKRNRRSHTLSFNFKRISSNKYTKSPNMNVLLRNTRNGINRNLSIFRSKTPTLKPAHALNFSASVGDGGKKGKNGIRKSHSKDKAFSSFTFFALKKKFLTSNGRSNSTVGKVNPAIVVNFENGNNRSQSNDETISK